MSETLHPIAGHGTEGLPFVTVIMPVRNEADYIARSLGSVLAQDYDPARMEIIVADGMSTDMTRAVVRRLGAEDQRLRLIDNPGRIVPCGWNAALQQARGDVIVRVDGHCEIAPDYVSRCVRHLEDGDGVGGPIETVGETFAARAIAAAMSSPFGVGDASFRTVRDRAMQVDTLAFPAYTRRAVERGGLFDEELVRNQDDEYNYRLGELGARLLLFPDLKSRYYSRSSFRSLWRQYFQYGYWKVRVMQKHPGQMRPRQFVPPLFVSALLATLLSGTVFAAGRWACASVLGAYLLVNLLASLRVARRAGDWRYAGLLPAAFATLHFSYGLGFLYGLLKFSRRWGDRSTRCAARHPSPLPRAG